MTNEVLQKTASDEQNVSSSNGLEPSLRFTGFYENWHEKYIKDVADVIGGGTPDTTKLEYWNGNIQWFTPTEIGHNKYVNKSKRTITEKGLKNSSAKLLPPKTILLTSRATIGECSIIEKECATNQGFQSLVPNSLINNEFCYYLINTKKKELLRKASGSTFLEISNSEIKQIKCKFPSLLEQQKIATFLSLMDTRIEKQRQLVESLKKYKRGLLSAIFDRKLRFKDTDFSLWKNVRLSECCLGFDNKRQPISSELREKGTVPYYGANGIQDYVKDYIFDGEYILLAEDGGHFDEFQTKPIAQYITGKSWVNNHAHILQATEKDCTKYIYYALVHKDIRKYINGSSRAKLNQEDMWQIVILLPNLKQQIKIAQFMSSIDKILSIEEKMLTVLEEKKQGLLQQMFI